MNHPRCSRWMKVSASFQEEENPTRWPPVTITVLVPCHHARSAQHVKSVFLCVCVCRVSFGEPCRMSATQRGKSVSTTRTARSTCRPATDASTADCRNVRPWACPGQVCSNWQSLQFSSVQDGICALGRAHVCFTPYLRHFASVAFETVLMFIWLLMAHSRPLKEDCLVLPLSMPLSSRRSVVWCQSPFTDHNGLLPFLWEKGKHCHGPCTAWLQNLKDMIHFISRLYDCVIYCLSIASENHVLYN